MKITSARFRESADRTMLCSCLFTMQKALGVYKQQLQGLVQKKMCSSIPVCMLMYTFFLHSSMHVYAVHVCDMQTP